MEDAADSKSADGNIVGVRIPPPAPIFLQTNSRHKEPGPCYQPKPGLIQRRWRLDELTPQY